MPGRPSEAQTFDPPDLVAQVSDALPSPEETPTISVVIPIYNEEESITALHQRLTSVMHGLGRPYEIIAVDDGSKDGTYSLLRQLASDDARLRVVRLRRNFGQTAAFSAGFARARGDVIVTIDADLQNDPADIPRLLERLDDGFDIVSGWRVHRRDPLWSRRFPSRLANPLISWFTGVSLHDYGCSLKAYRATVLRDLPLYGELHRFLPAIASWQGVAVAELPVNHEQRQAGVSKYGIGRVVKVLLDLVTVRFLLSYSTRPMQIFGLFGAAMMGLGLAISGYLASLKIFTGAQLGDRPLLLLGTMLIVVGVQTMATGLVGELIIRVHGHSAHRPPYVVREELNRPDAEASAP